MDTHQFIRDIRKGALSAELGDEILKAVAATEQTLKPSTVKVTITIKPMGNKKLKVSGSVDASLPKAEREETLFFIDEDGEPTRSMPHQRSLLAITEEIDR